MNEQVDSRMARALVLDELFDLTLYRELCKTSDGGLKKIFDELVPVETRHLEFWQAFFGLPLNRLDFPRRFKLRLLLAICRLFGPTAVHLVLEAIEIYGVKKYLRLWKAFRGKPLGYAVKGILTDEFSHEDAIVSQMSERKIDPERIRSIFLGFNDGLVEILGAVSGFFAAFSHSATVLMAGFTVAVAGALSMAAGAYVANSSENEVADIEEGKKEFLGQVRETPGNGTSPFRSSLIVGISYLIGAIVPILPVLLGASTVWVSVLTAGLLVVFVSFILAYLSGMAAGKRIITNLVIIGAAVCVTYLIGLVAKSLWGVAM